MNCICMYTPTAEGGHARYAWELMSALAAHPGAPYRFELVTSENLEPQFHSDRYPVHPILPAIVNRSQFSSTASWAFNRVTHYLRREMQFLRWLEGRPDVAAVHFQEWTPWLAAHVFRRLRRMGKRAYYTVHNVVPHRYPLGVPKPLMHRWIRNGCRACDGLFVHTDRLAGELSAFLGERHPPIRVVPHGVWSADPAAPAAPGATAGGGAAALSLDERLAQKRLLFFGTIRRNKGLDLLLRAMDHLPGYRLTIAGEPAESDYYHAEVLPLVRRLQAAGAAVDLRDRFMPDDEVAPLFAEHSAVVLPYTPGFVAQSGVVFLALAHGLPVVASEVGGLRDLMSQHPVGTSFRDGTPEAVAAAVRALCEGGPRPQLAEQIAAARRRFSWAEAARATLEGYSAAPASAGRATDAGEPQRHRGHRGGPDLPRRPADLTATEGFSKVIVLAAATASDASAALAPSAPLWLHLPL